MERHFGDDWGNQDVEPVVFDFRGNGLRVHTCTPLEIHIGRIKAVIYSDGIQFSSESWSLDVSIVGIEVAGTNGRWGDGCQLTNDREFNDGHLL